MERDTLIQLNMELISYIGTAKSMFIEAIDAALENDLEKAKSLYKEANDNYITGHKVHHKILTAFMNDEEMRTDILTVHAQCQLMSAEDFKEICKRVIKQCEKNRN